MPYQNIDASLSEADVKAIKESIAAILAKLPFLVNLTAAERKSTFKAGPNSLSFVTKAATAAQDNPNIFPASFDVPAYLKDVELFVALTELGTRIDSLASQIDDTRLAVWRGSDAGEQPCL